MPESKAYFNYRKSQFWPHAKVVRIVKMKFILIPFYLLYPLAIISVVYLLLNFIFSLNLSFLPFTIPFSNSYSGIASIIISLGLFLLSLHIYYKGAVEQPTPKIVPSQIEKLVEEGKEINLADYCSVAALLTLSAAISRSNTKDKNLVEAQELYKSLSSEERGEFVIRRLGFERKDFLAEVEKVYTSKEQQFKTVVNLDILLELALRVASIEQHPKIFVSDVLAALSQTEPFFKEFLFERNIKFEDILNIVYWQTTNEVYEAEKKFDPDRLKLTGGVGKDWAMGYALALSKFSQANPECSFLSIKIFAFFTSTA